ncbi:acetyltransferase [Shouchella clausii]|uniref:acetyltransferase n=1 Tax=Shouchella clausii TaxID=79880 RepID=UPI000BA51F9F|nr:acetyltransferase [Shouchella clausii]MBX0319600.1 acetyltransferase [Shouchella clausii]MCZ1182579.1 acetyltransferase [Shouchella clausii]MDO7283905.1 acetyltransferase [Shouchella clausii]MDO7304001.1 acetyltransferase [Shouchella clausii]PAF09774.1 hypothetical protein CHH65_08975 [Shouchella clausii]
MKIRQVIIIGEGGHSSVVQDIVNSLSDVRIVAILDDKYISMTNNGLIRGPIKILKEVLTIYPSSSIVIAIGDNEIRRKICLDLEGTYDLKYATLIHPSVILGSNVKIQEGTVIMPNVVINANVSIGKHVILNTGTVVEHDAEINDFVHLSPSVSIAGSGKVAKGVHMGIGSVMLPGMKIGAWSKIGAGGVVINNLPSYCTAVGVPAKVIKLSNNINS